MKILRILQDLAENRLDQKGVNTLIEECFRISKAYLYVKKTKIPKYVYARGLSINDIAIDAIANLFVKDEEGSFKFLKNAFQSWEPAIQNDEDALFFLHNVLLRRVEQHIVLLLKEADPFFSKILSSINHLIKKNGYEKTHHLGCVYVVKENTEIIKGKWIDDDSFNRIPAKYFEGKDLLLQLFQYIKDAQNFYPAIPLNSLVSKLKILNFNDFKVNESGNPSIYFEIDEIVENSLKIVFQKLENPYRQKGKLDEKEILNIRNSFADIAEDLKNGGINRGLYEYIHSHMTSLLPDEYYSKYQNIMEYLMRVMKDTVASRLKNF